MTANNKTLLVAAGAAFAGFLLGAVTFGGNGPPPSAKSTAAPSVASEAPTAPTETPAAKTVPSPPTPVEPISNWRVEEEVEAMSDQKIKTACTTSANRIQLSFPYGPRGARLCIRQHPRFGQDAYLTLDGSGQILCRSYDGCTIRIRFDDGAVQSFSANGPSDNSTETVFVSNTSRFIGAARSADRIRVQLEFYQNGVQTFDFPAKGLEW